MWTKDRIADLLRTNDKAVERAILSLFRRQTTDEQAAEDTKHTNQRGFSAAHAKRGSYYAKWIRSGHHLTGWHLDKAREIVLHYTRQLVEEANRNNGRRRPSPQRVIHREPPIGTYAATARWMAQAGIMSGDEADVWKDEMKEGHLC